MADGQSSRLSDQKGVWLLPEPLFLCCAKRFGARGGLWRLVVVGVMHYFVHYYGEGSIDRKAPARQS
jgi:hypothetical protein